MENKQIITRHLKGLGVPANLSGYSYLQYAIELVKNDFSYLRAITKRLYPAVAKEFNTTASRAERCIRHAIETGWNRGNIEFQNKLFGYTVDSNKGIPTNSEFIATVADYLSIMGNEVEKI